MVAMFVSPFADRAAPAAASMAIGRPSGRRSAAPQPQAPRGPKPLAEDREATSFLLREEAERPGKKVVADGCEDRGTVGQIKPGEAARGVIGPPGEPDRPGLGAFTRTVVAVRREADLTSGAQGGGVMAGAKDEALANR
ncbi:hypothetical protein [Brevundimonas sp.]|uniref:hypothetical protein n=1 Tax=Brevundimonas sp. TaxID=1871086 RepID=UPI003D0ACCA4